MLAFLIAHPEVISITLLFCSELMPLLTKGDSNGIVHLLLNSIQAVLDKKNGKS